MTKKNNDNKNNTKGAGNKPAPSKLKRKCIACNENFDRKSLLRILKEHKNNEVIINPNNKTFGRSAYICKKQECIDITIKKNKLQKALRMQIPEDFLEKLKRVLN